MLRSSSRTRTSQRFSQNQIIHRSRSALSWCRIFLRLLIHCSKLAGKVIRDCTIYDDGSDGPEVLIEFTDDTIFTVCLKTSVSVEAKAIRDEGGQPQVLETFTSSLPVR